MTVPAEATLHAAESLDQVWPLTLTSLARYASDRGDAEHGLALLRRAGVPPDDELVVLLEHCQSTPRPGLGRNQRCWCGSGRKYKVCHLRHEQLPLEEEERAAWLYQKAGQDLAEGSFRLLFLAAAQARARYWEFPDAFEHAIQDGLVCDAVLFEGGAFAEFLDVRGSLLPEDERLLAQQWPTGTVNLRSCGRSANHISLIRHTRPGESRRRTGENRPRIAQVDSAFKTEFRCRATA